MSPTSSTSLTPEELTALVDASSSLLWIATPAGERRAFNRTWYERTGRDESTELGFGFLDGVHEHDREALRATIARAAQHGTAYRTGYRLLDPRGEWMSVEEDATPRHANGELVGWIGNVRDRTLELREHDLRTGNRRAVRELVGGAHLNAVLERLALAFDDRWGDRCSSIMIHRPETNTLHVAAAPRLPAAYRELVDGIAIGPAAGCIGSAAHHRRRVIVTDTATDPLWAGARSLVETYGLRSCWATPLLSAGGRLVGTLAMVFRETGRRPTNEDLDAMNACAELAGLAIDLDRTRRELETSEVEKAGLLEGVRAIVWRADPDGRITYVSREAETVLGHPCEAWLEPGFRQAHTHPEDRELARLQLSAEPLAREAEFRMLRDDGSVVWLNERVRCATEDPARPDRIGVMIDVTDRKREEEQRRELERQVRQAQKNEAMGTLAGGIAHEFNNILLTIYGYTELVIEASAPEQTRQLREVLVATERATALVRQMLTYTRCQDRAKSPLELSRVLRDTLDFLRSSLPSSVIMRESIADELPLVDADAGQLHQVLVNLCTNASQAMPDSRGTLEVSAEVLEVSTPDGDLTPGSWVRIDVTDDGRGMNSRVRERIFDPFFTTQDIGNGSGLGLCVCQGIVKSHGGTIEVRSRPGAGTTVSVHLPASRRGAASSRPSGASHVLLVDDQPEVILLTTARLERLGYRVTGTSTAREALERIREHPPGSPGGYDLVITDQTMPEITGMELADELRAAYPQLPIMLTTGYHAAVTGERLEALDIRDVLIKPYSNHDLEQALQRVLGTANRKAKESA